MNNMILDSNQERWGEMWDGQVVEDGRPKVVVFSRGLKDENDRDSDRNKRRS